MGRYPIDWDTARCRLLKFIMKRRDAIQHIALISAGLAFLPACNVERWPVYENIPLERSQQQLIQWLTDSILPKGDLPLTTPEPTPQFVLRMINDCSAPEEIEQYLAGLQALQQSVEGANLDIGDMTGAESVAFLKGLMEAPDSDAHLKYLLKTTRQLTIQHFTVSQYFLTKHLGFEFAPGRFNGCVSV